MNSNEINSLASHIVARWHNSNEEPRLGELLLVELVYDMMDDVKNHQDKNGNFYTFIPGNMNKSRNFSIGYVEKERKPRKNNGSIFDNSKIFIVEDYGITPSDFGKYKFPFSSLTIKRWIYINEIIDL